MKEEKVYVGSSKSSKIIVALIAEKTNLKKYVIVDEAIEERGRREGIDVDAIRGGER